MPPPETNADAREAHEELVHLLVAAGWEPVGDGGSWYAERFRRPAERDIVEEPGTPEEPDSPEASVERVTPRAATRWAARLGILLLTVASVVIVGFTVLVVLGFFR